jgi:hypothetical protein
VSACKIKAEAEPCTQMSSRAAKVMVLVVVFIMLQRYNKNNDNLLLKANNYAYFAIPFPHE